MFNNGSNPKRRRPHMFAYLGAYLRYISRTQSKSRVWITGQSRAKFLTTTGRSVLEYLRLINRLVEKKLTAADQESCQKNQWCKLKPKYCNNQNKVEWKSSSFNVAYSTWVTHKVWDCKDDLKLLEFDDIRVELNIMPSL